MKMFSMSLHYVIRTVSAIFMSYYRIAGNFRQEKISPKLEVWYCGKISADLFSRTRDWVKLNSRALNFSLTLSTLHFSKSSSSRSEGGKREVWRKSVAFVATIRPSLYLRSLFLTSTSVRFVNRRRWQ